MDLKMGKAFMIISAWGRIAFFKTEHKAEC